MRSLAVGGSLLLFPDCVDFDQLGPFKGCFPLFSFFLFWFEAGLLSSLELVDMEELSFTEGLLGTSHCFGAFYISECITDLRCSWATFLCASLSS